MPKEAEPESSPKKGQDFLKEEKVILAQVLTTAVNTRGAIVIIVKVLEVKTQLTRKRISSSRHQEAACSVLTQSI